MTATRDVEQREPRTDEIRQILKEFKEQHAEEFEFARTLFSVLVDPDAYYRDDLSDDEACNVNSIFSEWCRCTHWTWGFSPESIRWLELAAQRLGELTEQPQPE